MKWEENQKYRSSLNKETQEFFSLKKSETKSSVISKEISFPMSMFWNASPTNISLKSEVLLEKVILPWKTINASQGLTGIIVSGEKVLFDLYPTQSSTSDPEP